jgi:hypothetical protein
MIMSFLTPVAPVSGPLAPPLRAPLSPPSDVRPIEPLAPEASADLVRGGADAGIIVESQATARSTTIDFVADAPTAFGLTRDLPPPLASAERPRISATQQEAAAIYDMVARFTG